MNKDDLITLLKVTGCPESSIQAVELAYELGYNQAQKELSPTNNIGENTDEINE